MFFELAEVLYVVQFTCSTNDDHSDAVQALQLAVYDRCARRASTLGIGVGESATGAQHSFRRVFLRLVFVNDAYVRLWAA